MPEIEDRLTRIETIQGVQGDQLKELGERTHTLTSSVQTATANIEFVSRGIDELKQSQKDNRAAAASEHQRVQADFEIKHKSNQEGIARLAATLQELTTKFDEKFSSWQNKIIIAMAGLTAAGFGLVVWLLENGRPWDHH